MTAASLISNAKVKDDFYFSDIPYVFAMLDFSVRESVSSYLSVFFVIWNYFTFWFHLKEKKALRGYSLGLFSLVYYLG